MLPYTASCDIESVIYTCLEFVTRLLRCENTHSSVDTLRPVARLSLLSHLSSLALHSARWNVPHPLAMRGGPSLKLCEVYYGRRVDDQATFHGVADI
uniref:Uncharacterized protein n=1 Tax=Timema bartmani TaxID=61472 RepID=A0A7R9I6H4_9NEOP|nr:unnamed protein product [Timema bartmani]